MKLYYADINIIFKKCKNVLILTSLFLTNLLKAN